MSNSAEKEQSANGAFGTIDMSGVVNAPLQAEEFEAEEFENKDGGETELKSSSKATYPADCYSFLTIHGPFDKSCHFFYFGFFVWAIQICFMILLVLRVGHPTLSTNENDDNPDMDQASGFAFANFVPSNNNILTQATQYMALIAYCFFADASVRDIVTAVEIFPNFSKVKPGDRVGLIIFSCFLRLCQGVMHTIVVFLLIINTSDVIEIILNFTAVNFISDFDNVAFSLCQWGKYGPALKEEADRIENLPAPACMYRKYQHIRYRYTICFIFAGMLISLVLVSATQHSLDYWLTTTLRIQFKDDPLRDGFNGCYQFETRQNRRVIFKSFEANAEEARIGYCRDHKKWLLFSGNGTSACDATEEQILAFSSKTYAFDISAVFEDTWYSPTGTPLELYFFDDEKNDLTDDECSSFIGDGICDDAFNIIDHNYDDGDCCGATCSTLKCGIGNIINGIFKDEDSAGSSYDRCSDPLMKPITIKIDNYYFETRTINHNVSIEIDNPFDGLEPIQPPMRLECDGINMLTVNLKPSMMLQTETVWIPDGASCEIYVKNTTSGSRRLPFVNYTIYHGDQDNIETNPIVIVQADSSVQAIYSFQRIPECYFTKLHNHVDIPTIYTGNDSSHKAIRWLLNDTLGFSQCEYDTFLERYALVTINYAAPIVKDDDDSNESSSELWVSPEQQCEWPLVACIGSRITEIDVSFQSLSGTIATEIGLLEGLTWLNFRSNNLTGTIPSEIEDWQNLLFFGVELNALTGTIPTGIGNMPNLAFFSALGNQMTGPVPSEIGKLSSLTGLALSANKFVGTIPTEIARLPLKMVFFEYNFLTGIIPTQLATLGSLETLSLEHNSLTGTIPSELGQLKDLTVLRLYENELTGSIPASLLEMSFFEFEYFGNPLSDLIPVKGEVICSSDGGDVYCNCASDCTFASMRCGCEEARSCCSDYIGNSTQCVVCPFGLENPYYILHDYTAFCLDMETYIHNDILQFGDEETCENVAKPFFRDIGCFCKSGFV